MKDAQSLPFLEVFWDRAAAERCLGDILAAAFGTVRKAKRSVKNQATQDSKVN